MQLCEPLGSRYVLPNQAPAASGYLQPVADPYGLDPRRISVDKNQQLGKGNYGEVFQGTVLIAGGQ